MAIQILEGKETESEDIAMLKDECGIEITIKSSSYGYNTIDLKFPDMPAAVETRTMYQNEGKTGMYIVDVDNRFLAYLPKVTNVEYYAAYTKYKYTIKILIVKDGTGFRNCLPYETDDWILGKVFNLASVASQLNDKTISIIPCYNSNFSATPSNSDNRNITKRVPKVYVNYQRVFERGLTLLDKDGNKWLTLGGYLLYKMN